MIYFVDGIIGAGKTTFINNIKTDKHNIIKEYPSGFEKGKKQLQKYLKGDLSPYKFQKEILKYYSTQYLMLEFLDDHDHIEIHDRWAGCVLPFTETLFKSGTLSSKERQFLIDTSVLLTEGLKKFSPVIIFIKCSFEKMKENINKRNRDGENNYSELFLENLYFYYNKYYIFLLNNFHVITLEGDEEKLIEDFQNYLEKSKLQF